MRLVVAGIVVALAMAESGVIDVEGRVAFDDDAPAEGVLVLGVGRDAKDCATKSGKDGSFKLSCVGTAIDVVAQGPNDHDGEVALQMAVPRSLPYTARSEPWRGVALTVERPRFVTGQVLEPDGKPAIGALVQWAPAGHLVGLDQPGMATTDEQGRFLLRGMQANFTGTVAALSKLHTPTQLDEVKPGATGLVLRFSQGSTLVGRIDALGAKAPARFTVELVGLPSGDAADRMAMRSLYATQLGDALGASRSPESLMVFARRALQSPDGSFAITGVGAGRYDLVVRADGGLTGWVEDLAITEGKTPTPMVVGVGRPAVRGRLVDADTGRPLSEIEVRSSPAPNAPVATTGADGLFALVAGAPGRTIFLFVSSKDPSYGREHFAVRSPAANQGDVGDLPILRRDPKRGRPVRGGHSLGVQLGAFLGGPIIQDFESGSPIKAAGLEVGDAFVSVASRSVARFGPSSTDLLLGLARGPSVEVEVRRARTGVVERLRIKRR
jgi:hypothetical protein